VSAKKLIAVEYADGWPGRVRLDVAMRSLDEQADCSSFYVYLTPERAEEIAADLIASAKQARAEFEKAEAEKAETRKQAESAAQEANP
jgi:topoisomerase IA-like protein